MVTPVYMDPQLLNNMQARTPNRIGYDEKDNIWSLGCLCYEMLVGNVAFSWKSMQELNQKLKQGKYAYISEVVFSFINGMLQKDPNKRLNTHDLLNIIFLLKTSGNLNI